MSLIEQLVTRLADYQPRSIDANFPEAGILVPITRNAIEPEIILTRRAQGLSTHQGQVAFPGGKFDSADQTLERTALRESQEEIGLSPSRVQVIAQLSQVVSLHGIRVTPYVGLIDETAQLTPNYDELDSIFRVPVSFFLTAEPVRRDKMTYKGTALSVPSYHYDYSGERYEIWGLSAIVLVELMNLAFDANITLFEACKREQS